MKPIYDRWGVRVYHGEAIAVMRQLPDASIEAVVTDPPYGLEFMGAEWDGANGFRRSLNPADVGRDSVFGRTSRTSPEYRTEKYVYQQWCQQWAEECLRVLRPGGHLLAFGGTRTDHRLKSGIEDAGFEIRNTVLDLCGQDAPGLAWMYASGFPKYRDVSKAIDRAAGLEREVIGTTKAGESSLHRVSRVEQGYRNNLTSCTPAAVPVTAPATDAARQWTGWHTALKPAWEPIVVARKPLAGTVAENVVEHGCGALNIAATRVNPGTPVGGGGNGAGNVGGIMGPKTGIRPRVEPHDLGRWPPNAVLNHSPRCESDGCGRGWCPVAELDAQSGWQKDGTAVRKNSGVSPGWFGDGSAKPDLRKDVTYSSEGGASRYFPVFRWEEKAPPAERPRVPMPSLLGLRADLSEDDRTFVFGELEELVGMGVDMRALLVEEVPAELRSYFEDTTPAGREVVHPTVKPLGLMRWLVRLVTPPGGTVLDLFAGSGTTGQACRAEGFPCILIERKASYIPLIRQRLDATPKTAPATPATETDAGPRDLFDLLGEP